MQAQDTKVQPALQTVNTTNRTNVELSRQSCIAKTLANPSMFIRWIAV